LWFLRVRSEEFGAAAVVLPSLFVEQIEHEDLEHKPLPNWKSERRNYRNA
jgi:hypothetical protein